MNESYRPNRSHNFSVNHGRNESRRDVLESLIKRESTGWKLLNAIRIVSRVQHDPSNLYFNFSFFQNVLSPTNVLSRYNFPLQKSQFQ